MSQPPTEPGMPEFGAPEPVQARPDRRILYTTIAVVIAAAVAIAAVFIFVPTNHKKLATGLESPSPVPATTAPTLTPSPSAAPSTAPMTSAPATSARATSAPAGLTSSSSGTAATSEPTQNGPSSAVDPAIPASFDPVQRVVAQAYVKFQQVTDEVWDNNEADIEVFNDVAEGAELRQLVDLATQRRGLGYESRGRTRVVKIDSVVLNADQTMATVTACYDASATSTIDLSTGKVLGQGDGPTAEVLYMHRGADGIWRTPGRSDEDPRGGC